MKKFFKILGISFLVIFAGLYAAFLFVLPRVVDLNRFKPMIQEIAKEQAKLDVDFEDIKVSTTPSLQAGIVMKNLKVNLPDKSELVSVDAIRARISLPVLLTLGVRVSCAEVEAPKITLDIENGKQYKVVKLVEEIVNSNKKDFTKVDSGSNQEVPAIVSMIRVVVPALTIKDYQVVINDAKHSQNMKLQGEKLVLGYYNGKAVRVESDAKLLVDDRTMISTDMKVKSFIPEFPPALDEEDDPSQEFEIPFVNPIDMYKKFNLQANLSSDIKVRNKNGKIGLKGFFNADDITMNMTGYQMPKSHLDLMFKGRKIFTDTDLYLSEKEHLQVIGKLGYGKRAFADMQIESSDIYFNNIIKFARDILNTVGVENTLADMKGNGYFKFGAAFKTNFKKMKSSGRIIVKDAGLSDRKVGLLMKDGNVDICLENNAFDIKKADLNINGAHLLAKGKIDEKAFTDLNIYTKNLSLKELYNAFAPASLKEQIMLSGLFSFDLKLEGALKEARAYLLTELNNFSVADRANTFRVTNDDFTARFDTKLPTLDGVIINKGLNMVLPSASTVVKMPLFVVNMDENDIDVLRSGLKFNNKSIINFNGKISNYIKNPYINFNVDGNVLANDLSILAGKDAMPFIDAKGSMPIRVSIDGTMKKLAIIAQTMTDANDYFTPIHIANMLNKQTIFQFKADYKGNRIKVKNTGIYIKEPADFNGDLDSNMANTSPVVAVNATIADLDSVPTINLLRVSIPKRLEGAVYALKNSVFKVDRTMLFAYGDVAEAQLRGIFRIYDIAIPDLFTTVKNVRSEFKGRILDFKVEDVLVNSSDFNIDGNVNLNRLPLLSINNLNIRSNNLDVNKLLVVSEAAAKLVPASTGTPTQSLAQPQPLPVEVTSGTINFKRIDSPPIVATATRGDIALKDSIFYLTHLNTNALGGIVRGDIDLNLLSMILGVRVHGEKFNVENALWVLANMKDALSGTASFDTDITIDAAATTQEAQMKSLKGNVDFEILKGQLGPFGRLENLILAENIRNSKFFETTIGSVVKSIATIETSHFEKMNGHLSFNDGIVDINPITTVGNVLCLHIAGNMNLLTNDADMKLRAKMGSQLSNLLGPLAALNPINLVKVTPGLNVMAAQAFQFFCEQITLEEMYALPDFPNEFTELSTTKFQVVLRGNLDKPFSMIKSFKWLALDSEIAAAESFVSTLPDPTLVEDAEHATYEEIMQAKAEKEALQAKEDAKPINRMKRFFSKFKKTNTDI